MTAGISEHPEGALVDIIVVPRAQPAGVGELRGERWLVRVAAAPVDGAANEAVQAVVARRLGVAKSAVCVVAGARSRRKRLLVRGLAVADAAARLAGER